ncbi:hypothetical protein ABEB36_012773 [Hypothenemus hampei]|uniref:Regulatory protein zeste n=1 Tax=Hypothenemus hampei TaxID=57062 RepID=A0ABD1ECG7_HYPHA
MDTNKRCRAPNYSNSEILTLISIVEKYKHIVDNKKTDNQTWKEKDEVWDKICNEFNSQSTIYNRSKESLKKYYENKKKIIRKQVAEERKELFKTGSGIPKRRKKDETTDLVLALMNN